MADKISRRQILSLGAATIAGGVAALGKESQATTHGGRISAISTCVWTTEISGRSSVLGEELQRRTHRCETAAASFTGKRLQAGRDPERRRATV